MQFCPKCQTKLRARIVKLENESIPALACDRCGHYEKVDGPVTAPDTGEREPKASIKVLGDAETKLKIMPTTKGECSKCGNTEAYWWFLQTRSGDEPPTQFHRCTKCEYTWRVYS